MVGKVTHQFVGIAPYCCMVHSSVLSSVHSLMLKAVAYTIPYERPLYYCHRKRLELRAPVTSRDCRDRTMS